MLMCILESILTWSCCVNDVNIFDFFLLFVAVFEELFVEIEFGAVDEVAIDRTSDDEFVVSMEYGFRLNDD